MLQMKTSEGEEENETSEGKIWINGHFSSDFFAFMVLMVYLSFFHKCNALKSEAYIAFGFYRAFTSGFFTL